jgi:hypothetical protein
VAAQDLERRDADTTSEEGGPSQSWLDAETLTEGGCYLYGRGEVQERRTAAPHFEQQARHLPVMVIEREGAGEERVKGRGITGRPGHHELAWVYGPFPTVVEQGVAAEHLTLFDLDAVELHALAA